MSKDRQMTRRRDDITLLIVDDVIYGVIIDGKVDVNIDVYHDWRCRRCQVVVLMVESLTVERHCNRQLSKFSFYTYREVGLRIPLSLRSKSQCMRNEEQSVHPEKDTSSSILTLAYIRRIIADVYM